MSKRNKIRKRISTNERRQILKRDRYICGYCGLRKKSSSLAIDHIIPIRYGGHHDIANFVSACRECNRKKWHFGPREKNSPRLIFHSGRKVAKITWFAKGKKFPARIPKISYKN